MYTSTLWVISTDHLIEIAEAVDVLLTAAQEKCLEPLAAIVATNAKFLSNPMAQNQFFAATVSKKMVVNKEDQTTEITQHLEETTEDQALTKIGHSIAHNTTDLKTMIAHKTTIVTNSQR